MCDRWAPPRSDCARYVLAKWSWFPCCSLAKINERLVWRMLLLSEDRSNKLNILAEKICSVSTNSTGRCSGLSHSPRTISTKPSLAVSSTEPTRKYSYMVVVLPVKAIWKPSMLLLHSAPLRIDGRRRRRFSCFSLSENI